MIERPSKRPSKTKVRFILSVTIGKRFSILQTIEGINFGLVRMRVSPYRMFWIIFSFDLVLSYTEKVMVFRWVQILLRFVFSLLLKRFRDFSV